jgi:acetyl-CoA carboxylase biotin carboxyl carrier protein
MIDLGFLEGLIKALDASSLDSIEIERGGTRIRLSKTAGSYVVTGGAAAPVAGMPAAPAASASQPAATPAEAAPPSHLLEVKSPMVGTFYRSAAPDAPAYVERGKRVKKGDTLCIIEAMKLMNELESEVDGVVAEILVDNAVPIEYGQVLFRIDPS